jgi:precorrin-6B methylase 1
MGIGPEDTQIIIDRASELLKRGQPVDGFINLMNV